MHNLMPTPFFFTITTIGMNHGNVEGLIIFVGSSPSLWSANFLELKGDFSYTLNIDPAFPTSMSHTALLGGWWKGVTLLHQPISLFMLSISAGLSLRGYSYPDQESVCPLIRYFG